MSDWIAIRTQFPALANWTYLNTATFGQIPDGRFINCPAEDIGFMSNSCASLSLLLGGIDWKSGDEILTLTDEFPNQFYYGEHLGARGVKLVEARPEALLDSVTSRTRVVALSSVNYNNGYVAPVQEIAAFLKPRGIIFYVDGTQSVGAHAFDIAAVQPDMLAVNAYKWMLSPNGAGFIYVSPKLRERLDPSVIGWRSDRDWRSVDNLTHGKPEFSKSSEKYEGGMLNFSALYAMGETMEMMLEIGLDCIEARVLELASRVRQIVRGMGATVRYEGSAIVAAHFPGVDVSALARKLREHRVIVAARGGFLRVSPHFYNNDADLDALESLLKQVSRG